MSIAVNVNDETFEDVTVFGRPMIFTCLRCDRSTLPKVCIFTRCVTTMTDAAIPAKLQSISWLIIGVHSFPTDRLSWNSRIRIGGHIA